MRLATLALLVAILAGCASKPPAKTPEQQYLEQAHADPTGLTDPELLAAGRQACGGLDRGQGPVLAGMFLQRTYPQLDEFAGEYLARVAGATLCPNAG